MFIYFLLIVEGEWTPDKGIPEGLFSRFRTKVAFFFRQSKQSTYYVFGVFGVFVDGRGGSMLTYFDKFRVVIFTHENRVQSMFWSFC